MVLYYKAMKKISNFEYKQNLQKVNTKWLITVFLLALSSCTFAIRTPAVSTKQLHPKQNLFRGVFHVHTNYSHDSKASLDLVIQTAEKAGLDFVVVTDHNNMKAAAAYQKMKKPDHLLLLIGDEISTWSDGHLNSIGIKTEPPDIENTEEIINLIHKQNGYAIISHPLSRRKPWPNWKIKDFDGLEIFCFSDVFYAQNPMKLLLKATFLTPRSLLKSELKNQEAGLKLWDEKLMSGRHIAAFGAADAHLKFKWHNFYVENYLLYFQAVTMYVLADEFKEEKITEALGHGRSFVAFEVYGLAQDFSFSASAENKNYGPGDSIVTKMPVLLTIKAPKESNIRLIYNGNVIQQNQGKTIEYKVSEPGYYRTEVYTEGKLWIVSNPIYLEVSPNPSAS